MDLPPFIITAQAVTFVATLKMDSVSASFPRGGLSASNDNSSKKRRANPSDDVLFGGSKRTARIEVKVDKKKKKNGKASDATMFSAAPSLGALGVGLGMVSKTSMTDKIVKIDGLNFTKYLPGTMALGYVLQIKNDQLVISLPGGVTGIVPNYEVSDVMHRLVLDGGDGSSGKKRKKDAVPALASLITVMQPVRVYVVEIKDPKLDKTVKLKKKTIILSMRQTLINRGLAFKHLMVGGQVYCCVKSREDHGYILTNGMDGVNLFLPLKGLKVEYVPGQPLDCVIEDINDDARIVTIKTNKKAVTNATTLGSTIPFSCLSPGMLFDVLVERIVQNGVIVSFSASFHGVIDNYSLPAILPDSEWAAKVPVGYTAKARIIYVDHANKGIRLSLRPHVVALAAPSALPPLGTALSDLKIVHIKKSTGVLLAGAATAAVDSEEKTSSNLGVFIHKSSLSDPSLVNDATSKHDRNKDSIIDSSRLTKVYRIGRVVEKVRIIGYFLVEGWALASNVSHLMEENSILHWSQVQVGTNLPVEITAIKEYGLVLKLDNYEKVQATCPLLHTSETGQVLTKLDKKFKIGQRLVMRVWEVNNKKGVTYSLTHSYSLTLTHSLTLRCYYHE
jgi:rRNA biogenesis protein RRP5